MKNLNPILHKNVIVMADRILNQLIDLETQLKYKYLKQQHDLKDSDIANS